MKKSKELFAAENIGHTNTGLNMPAKRNTPASGHDHFGSGYTIAEDVLM